MIGPFEKLLNTRDLGGLPAADGKTVRPGMLIRSGQLGVGSDKDIRLLEEMGISLVIDLRIPLEREDLPDPPLRGAGHLDLPPISESALGITRENRGSSQFIMEQFENYRKHPEKPNEYMTELYRKMADSEDVIDAYSRFLRILSEQDGAVLWHCTAGKDRAGLASALTLLALGASMETVMKDYLETNDRIEPEIRRAATFFGRLVPDMDPLPAVRAWMGVFPIYLEIFFRTAGEKYGSLAAFLRDGLGLDDALQWALRNKYLQ